MDSSDLDLSKNFTFSMSYHIIIQIKVNIKKTKTDVFSVHLKLRIFEKAAPNWVYTYWSGHTKLCFKQFSRESAEIK